MRVPLGLVEFRRQFVLQLRAQVMFDLFRSRVQVIAWQNKMTGHVGFPQTMRSDQILRESSSIVRQLIRGR